jgi:hypothetical protein
MFDVLPIFPHVYYMGECEMGDALCYCPKSECEEYYNKLVVIILILIILVIVVMSNNVNFLDHNKKVKKFRSKLFDIVFQILALKRANLTVKNALFNTLLSFLV